MNCLLLLISVKMGQGPSLHSQKIFPHIFGGFFFDSPIFTNILHIPICLPYISHELCLPYPMTDPCMVTLCNIYHQYTPHVTIYTSTMDPMGMYLDTSIFSSLSQMTGCRQTQDEFGREGDSHHSSQPGIWSNRRFNNS